MVDKTYTNLDWKQALQVNNRDFNNESIAQLISQRLGIRYNIEYLTEVMESLFGLDSEITPRLAEDRCKGFIVFLIASNKEDFDLKKGLLKISPIRNQLIDWLQALYNHYNWNKSGIPRFFYSTSSKISQTQEYLLEIIKKYYEDVYIPNNAEYETGIDDKDVDNSTKVINVQVESLLDEIESFMKPLAKVTLFPVDEEFVTCAVCLEYVDRDAFAKSVSEIELDKLTSWLNQLHNVELPRDYFGNFDSYVDFQTKLIKFENFVATCIKNKMQALIDGSPNRLRPFSIYRQLYDQYLAL